MPTVMPQSELLRKALIFVDERRREKPAAKLSNLLDEAGMRFNLSPRDSEALLHLFSTDVTSADVANCDNEAGPTTKP